MGRVVCLTRGACRADALVLVDQVDTPASILAGAAVALLDLDVAYGTRVARVTLAPVAGDAVFADAVVAGLGVAVVDVFRAQRPRVSYQKLMQAKPLCF